MSKLISLLLLISVAHADYEVPKNIFGQPDLQGTWSNATITPLERPYHANDAVVSSQDANAWERQANAFIEQDQQPISPDAPAPADKKTTEGYESFWVDRGTNLAVINGQIRTSLISFPTNGKIPYKFSTEAKLQDFLYNINNRFDHPEQRPPGERCLVGYGSSGGPPMLPVLYNNHMQIVQNENHVLIHVEMNHDARIIRLNAKHTPLPEIGRAHV